MQLFVQSWETLSQKEKNINQLNRWKIYEGFVEHWLKTQKHLLSENIHALLARTSSDLFESFQDFATQVAFTAFCQKTIALSVKEIQTFATPWARLAKAVEADSRKIFKDRQSKLNTKIKRRALLAENEYIQIMMSRLQQFEIHSPLKRRAFGYEFTHKSFFEYFAAKHLLQLIQRGYTNYLEQRICLIEYTIIQEEPEILHFWREGWEFQQHEGLVEPLFKMIEASKTEDSASQAARMQRHY